MKFKRIRIYLVLFISLLALIVMADLTALPKEPTGSSNNCITKNAFFEVRGSSLAPLINPGQAIKLVYGYYNCRPVERGDIIAYKYAGNNAPIIKIVKAVPGDRWRLKKDNHQNCYQIIVNDRLLKNSEGEFYQIPESNIKMIQLYVKSYPILPENTYLILGNRISGTLDATRFGLVDKSDILGKVE